MGTYEWNSVPDKHFYCRQLRKKRMPSRIFISNFCAAFLNCFELLWRILQNAFQRINEKMLAKRSRKAIGYLDIRTFVEMTFAVRDTCFWTPKSSTSAVGQSHPTETSYLKRWNQQMPDRANNASCKFTSERVTTIELWTVPRPAAYKHRIERERERTIVYMIVDVHT